MWAREVCTIEGCERPHLARGWCSLHYYRWRSTGTTEPPPPRRTHGKHSTYCAGCRCDDCTEAHRVHMQRWRSGATKIDPEPRYDMDRLVGL